MKSFVSIQTLVASAVNDDPDYQVYQNKNNEIIEFCAPVFWGGGEILGFVRYGISTASMHQALSEVLSDGIRTRNQIIFVLGCLAIISLVAGYFMVRQLAIKITKPIRSIVDLVRQIAEGNYDIPVISGHNDEIGLLETDIEKMRIHGACR
ncbi:MAG: HAMP domain-containing protein [Proteobacteria bacterium]|nr:HAMP domain-containing protein [Pseudomonadota bacterium]